MEAAHLSTWPAWIRASVGEPPSGLSPQGPGGDALAGLWWVMFWLAAAVFVVVCALLAVSLVRRRELALDQDALTGERFAGGGNLLILVGGVAIPIAVTVLLMALTVTTGRDVRALGGSQDALVAEVTGYQFWWDVRYPGAGIRTANEVQIPVGRPVELHVTAADVIHSIWIPQLGPKIDMIPGEQNVLRLQADQPGVYRGLCTEYCGIQHALMHFMVVAVPPGEFDAWVAARADPPAAPAEELALRGRGVFEDAQCVLCHTVRGASPETDLGPDLTHFGSRLTLGAGARPNDPEQLAAWILDPHTIKPGNHMPPSPLAPDELEALIAYLQSLR